MTLKLDKLKRIQREIDPGIDRGTYRGATMIKDLAVQFAPEDEGDLKSTGRVEPAEGSGNGVYRIVFGGISGPNKFVGYAADVEYGTDVSEAQPYLTPAFQAIDVAAEIKKELQAVLR